MDRCGHRSGRTRSRTDGCPGATLVKPYVECVLIHTPDKGNIRPLRKSWKPLDLRAPTRPIEVEIVHGHGALGVPHIHDRGLSRAARQIECDAPAFWKAVPAHIHFQHE